MTVSVTNKTRHSPPIVRSLDVLADRNLIGDDGVETLRSVTRDLPFAITQHLLSLIDPNDPRDPIALQFIPDRRETDTLPEERNDPIGDAPFSPLKGVVHRYPDRILLKPLMTCPAHCRFCFRRDRVGGKDKAMTDRDIQAALKYIKEHAEIWEVILSGGDPLMMPAGSLGFLVSELAAIEHVAVVRIHSRLPVTDPSRITAALIGALHRDDIAVYLAIHCNHAREISLETRAVCARLSRAGIPLLGQTVLLRGVNDTPEAMEELLRAMVRNRIKPYYLHHADLARGTAHFRTEIAEGQALMRALRGRLSGVCLPSYVLDIPGGAGKSPLTLSHWDEEEKTIEDWHGKKHAYPPFL